MTYASRVDTRGARPYIVESRPNDIAVFCDVHGERINVTEGKPEKFTNDKQYREWLGESAPLVSESPDKPENEIDSDKLSDLIDKAFDKLKD